MTTPGCFGGKERIIEVVLLLTLRETSERVILSAAGAKDLLLPRLSGG